MIAILAALALVAVADEPQAAPAAPAADAETSAEARRQAEREAELDRVVCRREHVVGTNRPQRICMTVREWEHQREMAREIMRDDRFSTGMGRGAGEMGD